MSNLLKFLSRAPVGSSFDPGTLTELKAWYKTPFGGHSDGDNLTTWTDASGNANTITFSGGVASDTQYKTNQRNGLDIVRSANAVRVGTSGSAIDFSSGGSIYIVCQGGFTGNNEGLADDAGSGNLNFIWADGGQVCQIADAGFAHSANSPAGTFTNWQILHCRFTNASMKAGINGTYGSTTSATLTWPNHTISFPASVVGLALWGDIGEGLFCKPNLSDANDTNVINYLKSRWAIS